jgi:hypothetical protein
LKTTLRKVDVRDRVAVQRKEPKVSLLRAVLALIVVLILAHIVVFRLGYDPATNEVVAAVYSLGELVEYPVRALLPEAGFYGVALTAAAGYLIVYILVGLLRGRMYRQP